MKFEIVSSAIFLGTVVTQIVGWFIGKPFPDASAAALIATAIYIKLCRD